MGAGGATGAGGAIAAGGATTAGGGIAAGGIGGGATRAEGGGGFSPRGSEAGEPRNGRPPEGSWDAGRGACGLPNGSTLFPVQGMGSTAVVATNGSVLFFGFGAMASTI